MYLCIPPRVGVRDAVLEIWQANNQGNYDPVDTPMYQQINYDYTNVNANPNGYNCRARVRSDQDGKFSFDTSELFTGLIAVFVVNVGRDLFFTVRSRVENTDHSFNKQFALWKKSSMQWRSQ